MFHHLYNVFQPLFSSNVWISSWTFVLHCTGQNDCELASTYRFQKGYWLRSIATDFNPKLSIKFVIIFFLQSYVLVALVRRQLTSCIPTWLIESKGWRLTEFSQIGYRCIVVFLKAASKGHSCSMYLSVIWTFLLTLFSEALRWLICFIPVFIPFLVIIFITFWW